MCSSDLSLTKLLYEYTKDWTSDTLLTRYKAVAEGMERKDKITAILLLGAQLFSEITGIRITLDPKHILQMAEQTQAIGVDDMKELMIEQIRYGKHEPNAIGMMGTFKSWNWVRSPIYPTIHNGQMWWVFSKSNIIELQDRMMDRGQKRWSMDTFLCQVKSAIPVAISAKVRCNIFQEGQVVASQVRGVLIPQSAITLGRPVYDEQGTLILYEDELAEAEAELNAEGSVPEANSEPEPGRSSQAIDSNISAPEAPANRQHSEALDSEPDLDLDTHDIPED